MDDKSVGHASGGMDALVRRALRLARRGRREEAIHLLEEVVSRSPEHPFGRLHLAVALVEEGREEEAVAHAGCARAVAPERAAVHLMAGRVFFDAAHHAVAADAFARAVALSPENDLAAGFERLNAWAMGDAGAAMGLHPDRLPDSPVFLARLLFMIESALGGRRVEYEMPDARPVFLDRMRISILMWRGMALRRRGKPLEAMFVTDSALEMCPGHPAVVRFQRDCRSEALGVVRRLLDERPDSFEERLMLANLLLEEEDYSGAEAALAGADGTQADAPHVHRIRARIAFGLGRVDEALRETIAGMEPGFSMPESNYLLGLCHAARGERRLSFRAFEDLARQVCWAVPLRLREYQAWARGAPRPPQPSAVGT